MAEKILIVDDNPEIREIVHVLLSSEGYTIHEAQNGNQALEQLDDTIDLIILDIMMPHLNGYQTCLKIRERSNAPILFLTAKGQDSDKTLAFSSGGDDYLTKPFSYNELNARVKALLRRYNIYQGNKKESIDLPMIRFHDLTIDERKHLVKRNEHIVNLTEIEYDLLNYFIHNRRQILNVEQIFEAIWKEPYYYGANNTIMVHIRNLRKKIEQDPQEPVLIKTSWGKGYYCE